MHRKYAWVFALALITATSAACKKGDGDGGGSAPAPAKPANGSPIAAEFVKFTEGKRGKAMEIKVYNFGPKTGAGYMILARYKDKEGKVLTVKPGTAFEKDFDFTSVSGGRYKAEPNKWTTFEVSMMSIPAEAASAEVVISKASAVAEDGVSIEDWWSQERFSEWPSSGASEGGQ